MLRPYAFLAATAAPFRRVAFSPVKRTLIALLLVTTARAVPAASQTAASVGFGVGTVRYPEGASFSAALSPAVRYSSPSFMADVAGSIASLPGAVWSSQGRADLWAATAPLTDGVRLGAEGIVAASSRSDGGSTAAAHGIGEVLWSAPRWGIGVGAGPSWGWSGGTSVAAFHARGRAWWRPGAATDWQLSVEPTRFQGAWFTDATAGVTVEGSPATLFLSTSVRSPSVYGSEPVGSAFLRVFVSRSVSLELGGGKYLSDPYQGLPPARFVTVGLRLHGARPPRPPQQAPPPQWTPLVPDARGDSLVVRFHMAQAGAVAIAGDWNAWQPLPLRPVGDDVWEGALVLARGLYHFNLLVDGRDWVVPNGVATVSDGLGGMVGVLVVP